MFVVGFAVQILASIMHLGASRSGIVDCPERLGEANLRRKAVRDWICFVLFLSVQNVYCVSVASRDALISVLKNSKLEMTGSMASPIYALKGI
ncbi:hypothetical protein EV702DRAFT_1122743 [Suillus placidus]|uniref:Uncharacterized protein n=1 Tax=Suillus placidus TaxID=48579 RepID=A0A9P6ZPR4_9AGAM|nr:hypothetical protein EV702DRAFT_1122743 [Suillus placidus]